MSTHLASLFATCDAYRITLWREGASIRWRASGTPPAALLDGLRAHRGEALAALAAYPNSRREPGADEQGWTEASEELLATLRLTLQDFERDAWTAHLARLWSRGVNGREAARLAHAALEQRCAKHRQEAIERAGWLEGEHE